MTPKGSKKLKDMINEMNRHRQHCEIYDFSPGELVAHGLLEEPIVFSSGGTKTISEAVTVQPVGFKYWKTSVDGLYETYVCESCGAAVTVPVGKREYYENDPQGLDE